MPPRICFVSPRVYGYFDPEQGYTGGGAERQIYLLSTALASDFDVHAVVADYGQGQTERREGVTLHRAYPLQKRTTVFQPVKHLYILARTMQRADADIYVHRGRPRNAAFVYLLTRILGRKWVYHIPNDANLRERPADLSWPIRRLYDHALRNADAVVAQTTRQQRLLRETYQNESTVIPNGYPTAGHLRPYSERECFLWVGSLTEDQKRPHVFLDLAERLPESTFRLVGPIDPDNEYQQSVSRRAREMENVELVGAIPPDEIHAEYERAIALVNTSAYEGFPNTFLEAWRQGTPVVSLDIDPNRFLPVEYGYAHGDRERLESILHQLNSDPALREEIGKRSKNLFEESFSLPTITEQYATLLESL